MLLCSSGSSVHSLCLHCLPFDVTSLAGKMFYVYTVNILKIVNFFCISKLTFCCLLAKIRAFLRNWSLLPFLGRLCIEHGRGWRLLCHSIGVIRGYHVYKEVWNPSIGEAFVFIKHGDKMNGEITLPLPKLEVFPNFRDGQ